MPLLLLLLACGEATPPPPPPPGEPAAAPVAPPSTPPEPTPTSTTPAAAGSPPATSAPSAALPDLSQGLPTGLCANGPGKEGADSHFIGSFTVQGNQVSGTERWLLAANPHLQSSKLWNAGPSCEVIWAMRGQVVAPTACSSCDLGLKLTATVDQGASTCPEDMVKREKSFEVSYDVKRGADGVAVFYFSRTGKPLGQGYHKGGALNYVTQHQCKWF